MPAMPSSGYSFGDCGLDVDYSSFSFMTPRSSSRWFRELTKRRCPKPERRDRSESLRTMTAGSEGGTMDDRLLYRVKEVAEFLNVSRSKVYELLASGSLPSVKIDRTRLVRGSDLRLYVESLDLAPLP